MGARAAAPSPVPKNFVPKLNGMLAVIHYCQFYSIPVKGEEHRAGYSFGKYDYSGSFKFRDISKKLLECPPNDGNFNMPAPTLEQEVWRAWENVGRPAKQGGLKEGNPPKKNYEFGGHRNSLPGGLRDRRRVFLIRELTAWLDAAMHNYRVRTCGEHAGVLVLNGRVKISEPTNSTQAHSMQSLTKQAREQDRQVAQQVAQTDRQKVAQVSAAASASAGPRIKVAVAITVADDGPQGDGAAVMAASVRKVYNNHPKYDLDLIAIVSPTTEKMLPILNDLGFKIIKREVPVKVEELENPIYRKKAPTSGCCGLTELLKLEAWTLDEYKKVLLLDMDTIMVSEVDVLWELDIPVIFTRPGGNTQEHLQGGVIMVKPNRQIYNEVLAVVRKGDFRYDGTGWEGSGVGFSYGGETVQGVLPFFFRKKAPAGSYQEVDMCIFNNMGDSDRCRQMDPAKVKIFHFTVCQKPWYCLPGRQTCKWGQDFWWKTRNEIETARSLPVTPACTQKFDYKPMALPKQEPSLYAGVMHGCQQSAKGCAKFL